MRTSTLFTHALRAAALAFLAAQPFAAAQDAGEPAQPRGWLSWRGPNQNGTSPEVGLVERFEVGGENWLWSRDLAGRGTPVVSNGRVYAMGYEGEGKDLQELLVCLDAETGETLWERRFNDFLSEVIYSRYAIGSPTIDPETGNVVCLTTAGLICMFTGDGELLWEHSLPSEYGRLTFPNGRTGAAVIDGDRVIMHFIFSSWGPHGPAKDRFLCFDKTTGACLWVSSPGESPIDGSFSMPVLDWQDRKRVLWAGTGCGNLVCIDARTGDALWRYKLAMGGVNAAPVLYGDTVIAVHGKENVDASTAGRLVALLRGAAPEAVEGTPVLPQSAEVWRNGALTSFTSSPVLVGDRLYQTVFTGELVCVDAKSGKTLWHEKLASDQLHASPAWGDGKLYVPMNDGTFWVFRPTDEGAEQLCQVQLEGNCLGAPAICDGRVYVHTTEKLYCFGGGESRAPAWPAYDDGPKAGAPARLQLVPADVLLRPGESIPVEARWLDADGALVRAGQPDEWAPGRLPVTIADGRLTVAEDAGGAVGVLGASAGTLRGSARVRIVDEPPYTYDFDDAVLDQEGSIEGEKAAFPPPHWIGARLKWEIVDIDGDKVLAKAFDRALFMRTLTFFGHPAMKSYTMTADVRTDGNRRSLSSAGVVNQRYLIWLKGNHRELEVNSNQERIKEAVPFDVQPDTWYRLKTRVDVAEDGSGVVRAKAWERDQPEPEAWTIEVEHANAHQNGAPGLFGFTPQNRFRVYVDNVTVTPNE